MLPWSGPVWRAIPELDVLQFPYRFCTVLTTAVAGLVVAGYDQCLLHGKRTHGQQLAVLTMTTVTVIGAGALTWGVARRFTSPDTVPVDATRDIDKMYRTYVAPGNLKAFASMLGTSPDTYDVASTSVGEGVRAECVDSNGIVSVHAELPERFHVVGMCSGKAAIRVSQLYSPLWTITSAGRPWVSGAAVRRSPEGLLEVVSDRGRADFELAFDGGWPTRCGLIVTCVALLFGIGGLAYEFVNQRAQKPTMRETVCS